MTTIQKSKWLRLLYSAIIAGAFAVFFMTRDHSRFTTIDSRFILFLLAWGITIISSPVILVLRLIRLIPDSGSLMYILTGTINCFIGSYGLFELFRMGYSSDLYQEALLLTANVLVAAFILFDSFVKEIPGFPLRKRVPDNAVVQEG
jgi:hypothetical protein